MANSDRNFPHPITGDPASQPWCRDKARRMRRPQYRSETPCPTCNYEPCYRYVRSDACVRCMSLDLTSVTKGEPLRVMQVFPEDKLHQIAPSWHLDAGITDEALQQSTREMLDEGYTPEAIKEMHIMRGWYIFQPGTVLPGTPCPWGPHIRHLDADDVCSSCEKESPSAKTQFEEAIGADLTRDEAAKRGLTLYVGEQCINGHEGWRFVSNDRCWECFNKPGGTKAGTYTAAQQRQDNRPVDFETAHASGLPLFMGNPCSAGHPGWRRVKGRACYDCSVGAPHQTRAVPTAADQFEAGVPVSLADASEARLMLFKGNPCKLGHSGWRRVKGRACYECGIRLPPPGAAPQEMARDMAAAFGFKVYWAGDDVGWQLV